MPGLRCPECESFVGTFATGEINETNFDESSGEMEVEIHMVLCCENCDYEFGELTDTSSEEVSEYLMFLDENEEAENEEISYDDADLELSIETRKGKKFYVAKWSSKIKVGEKIIPVNGEYAITRNEFELY